MNNLYEQLRAKGYVVIPHVLSANEVSNLRQTCKQYCDETCKNEIDARNFLSHPALSLVPFHTSVINAIKLALNSPYILIPEFTMLAGKWGDWHFDAGALHDAKWMYDEDYQQIECAIYLQDVHSLYAGGLEVIPYTHRLPRFLVWPNSPFNHYVRHINFLLRPPKPLNTKAGDLIIWDFRLYHRGAHPKTNSIPAEHTKYGIFFGAVTTPRHANLYMQNMKDRGNHGDKFYESASSLKYPEHYPSHLVEIATEHGISVATL